MEYMLMCAVWAIVAYFGVKEVCKKLPNLDVNPTYYAVGSFIFGILWCALFLAYKVYEHKKHNKFFKNM